MNHWEHKIPFGYSDLCNQTRKWDSADSEELFDKNKPEGWTKDCITYSYNSYGYRSQEFIKNGNYTVLSIGCSNTYGIGLPLEYTWPERFRIKLEEKIQQSVNNFNFAIGGQGNDYIARVLYNVIPIIQPDLVLILFSQSSRREYVADDNHAHTIGSWHAGNERRKKAGISKRDNEIINAYVTLQNEYSDQYNFLKNYNFIKLILQDIPFFTSTWSADNDEFFKATNNYAGYFKRVENDLARDQIHSGPITMENLATRLYNKYITNMAP